MKRCVQLPRRCLSNVSLENRTLLQADHQMDMSHQPLLLDTTSNTPSNTHLRRNSTTPKVRFRSRHTPHRTPTKASNRVPPLPSTKPPHSLKQTQLIHPITLPTVYPANHSMLNTRTFRVQVLTESLPEHLVIHLTNLIDRLPNLEQREWGLEINQQLGKLIIDNKLNRGIKSLSKDKENTRLNMVLPPTLPNSNKVRDLVVMDMGMCPRSKGRLME